MVCGVTCWLKSVLLMALLCGALGGMGAWGYFFFENREMCPCAPAGLEDAEGLTVAQPYSDDLMMRRALSFGGVGALIGVVIAALMVAPRASRLKDALDDPQS